MRFGETPNCQSLLLRPEQALNEGCITGIMHMDQALVSEKMATGMFLFMLRNLYSGVRNTYGVPWTQLVEVVRDRENSPRRKSDMEMLVLVILLLVVICAESVSLRST